MPHFVVKAPDGTTYDVQAPEGATEQDVLARVQAMHGGQAPAAGRGSGPPYDSVRDWWNRGMVSGLVREPLQAAERLGADIVGEGRTPQDPGVERDILTAVPALTGTPLSPASVARGTGPGLAAVSRAGRAPSPQDTLMEAGVELTPGQMAGGIPRRAEEAFKSVPILGSFIRGAEGRTIESFNTAVINQALAPIKGTLPKGTSAGNEAIAKAHSMFDAAYDKLRGRINFRADDEFANDLTGIEGEMAENPTRYQQWQQIVSNRVLAKIQPGDVLTGDKFKEIESDLGRLSAQYRSSPDPDQRALAYALDRVKFAMRANLERSNPEQAAELRSINSGYAMLVRVEGAAARRATSGGVFTPSDLLAAVKTADPSVRKTDFARGDALLQEFAKAAQQVIPGKLPDSGTPERAFYGLGARDVLAGAGEYAIDPNLLFGTLGASALYSTPATRGLNALMSPRPTESVMPRPGPAISSPAFTVLTSPGKQPSESDARYGYERAVRTGEL